MKRVFIIFTFALISLSAASETDKRMYDWANFARYAEMNKIAEKGANAVFMGNSITEGWVGTNPSFFNKNGYIGRGISGQVTAQMLVRFRNDVVALQPKVVVILAGTNDIARNNGYITIQNIMGNIVSMCEIAEANGIDIILCSVLPVESYHWFAEVEPAEAIVQLNHLIRGYAEANNYPYVDFHSVMRDENNGLPDRYATDGVHPTLEGYQLMESIIKPVIDRVVDGK